MRLLKNLSVYFLSASLVFVGLTSANLAQGASNDGPQIVLLEKQISVLQAQVGNRPGPGSFATGQNLESRVARIELTMNCVKRVPASSFFRALINAKSCLFKK